MLGFIQGKILSKSPDANHCVVLAGDVGYEIVLPKNLFESLELEQPARFWIYTHVREDQLVLFGFRNESEKAFFRQLLGVSGVGPKAALSLLGEHGVERLIHLIMTKSAGEISQAPGVGKKLAERLVLELNGKVEKWAWVVSMPRQDFAQVVAREAGEIPLRDDLSSALAHLGYQPSQIKSTLDRLFEEADLEKAGFEHCLKTALKAMSNVPTSMRGGN